MVGLVVEMIVVDMLVIWLEVMVSLGNKERYSVCLGFVWLVVGKYCVCLGFVWLVVGLVELPTDQQSEDRIVVCVTVCFGIPRTSG